MKAISLLTFLVLTAGLLAGQAAAGLPVQTEIRLREPADPARFVMEIRLTIAEDTHVYTSEEQFFRVQISRCAGLGPMEVQLPATKKYTNFDGSQVDVLDGHTPVITVIVPFAAAGGEPCLLEGYFQYQACTEITCFPPQKVPFSFKGTVPAGVTQDKPFYQRGLFLGILFSFLAGLGLSLTPCVYPMVGITVAIIGTGSASRLRTVLLTAVYVLGLALVYGLVGIVIASAGDKAHAASAFLRSAWILVPIGVIFLVLGLSMFDLLTLQTPSSFAGRIQALTGRLKGSVPGTFLMGGLSAFVVGPCISGPLLGLILFVMNSGEKVRGFAYFFALAWGMGMILFAAGIFSGALPRAGMWMERVKHLMGVVLIWAAFYFTRSLIGENVFWAAGIVAVALGLNSLGLFQVPASGASRGQVIRMLLGILLFGTYVYYASCENRYSAESPRTQVQLESILAAADRPVILDFTAPWCANCKEIEETVLMRPDMQEQLARFKLVKVDFDTNPKLTARYNIIGPPAFVFVDKASGQIGTTIVTGKDLERSLYEFDFVSSGK